MKYAFATVAAIFLLSPAHSLAGTQSSFDAADVHVSPAGATQGGGVLPGGRIEFHATTLLGLIASSWGVTPARVAGGPAWLDADRFEVVAKAPAGASRAEMRSMLQNLLAERFGLSVKSEERTQPVFALVMGKHKPPKEAKPVDPTCEKSVLGSIITFACRNTTMPVLVDNLNNLAGAYFPNPLIDRTGLTAGYDFQLQWMVRSQLPAGPEGIKDTRSLNSSLEKELGLAVEPQTAPVTWLTVVRANRTPVPNPPGTVEKLGKTPTEFEVADLRLSRSGETSNFKVNNGRIEARSIALKDLIEYAYKVVEDEGLRGGDKWIASTRYDLVAKTAPTTSEDAVRVMLQALLRERFGLKVHADQAPLTVYALTSIKPRLKPADPEERSGCKPGMVDGRVEYTCLNVTMAQFCEKLQSVAVGYLDHPLIDLSGLSGAWDFKLLWAPVGRTRARVAGQPAGPGPEGGSGALPVAQDPNGDLTLFEAVDRQLGLKIASQKHTMPVIVIDHVEHKATDN